MAILNENFAFLLSFPIFMYRRFQTLSIKNSMIPLCKWFQQLRQNKTNNKMYNITDIEIMISDIRKDISALKIEKKTRKENGLNHKEIVNELCELHSHLRELKHIMRTQTKQGLKQ